MIFGKVVCVRLKTVNRPSMILERFRVEVGKVSLLLKVESNQDCIKY